MNGKIKKSLTTPVKEYPSVQDARQAILDACSHNEKSKALSIEYVRIMNDIGHLLDNNFVNPDTRAKQERSWRICDELLVGESIGEY